MLLSSSNFHVIFRLLDVLRRWKLFFFFLFRSQRPIDRCDQQFLLRRFDFSFFILLRWWSGKSLQETLKTNSKRGRSCLSLCCSILSLYVFYLDLSFCGSGLQQVFQWNVRLTNCPLMRSQRSKPNSALNSPPLCNRKTLLCQCHKRICSVWWSKTRLQVSFVCRNRSI